MCKSPWANHSWNTTLYLTSRGLTTSNIPLGDRSLNIDIDFIDHRILFNDSTGKQISLELKEESVASFYERFREALDHLDVKPTFEPAPNEVMDATPFYKDEAHCTYNKHQAGIFFQVLTRVSNVLQDFRADFVGKSSPVHFFWGSFDIAVTRFSGRRAPQHPGGIPHLADDVVREAYSHEVISCGFWPGNDMYPHAAFYAYAYPEPQGFSKARVSPAEAYYHPDLHEYLLDYDVVRKSNKPEELIKQFCNSTYKEAAHLGSWDRIALEISPELAKLREHARFSSGDPTIRQ
jgi:hypothetical protein